MTKEEQKIHIKEINDYAKNLKLARLGYNITKGASPQQQLDKQAKEYYLNNEDKFETNSEKKTIMPAIGSQNN